MLTLLLRSISRAVRRRFPTLQDLVKNGEIQIFFNRQPHHFSIDK